MKKLAVGIDQFCFIFLFVYIEPNNTIFQSSDQNSHSFSFKSVRRLLESISFYLISVSSLPLFSSAELNCFMEHECFSVYTNKNKLIKIFCWWSSCYCFRLKAVITNFESVAWRTTSSGKTIKRVSIQDGKTFLHHLIFMYFNM